MSNQEIDLRHQELEIENLESMLHHHSRSQRQSPVFSFSREAITRILIYAAAQFTDYYNSIDSEAVSKKKER